MIISAVFIKGNLIEEIRLVIEIVWYNFSPAVTNRNMEDLIAFPILKKKNVQLACKIGTVFFFFALFFSLTAVLVEIPNCLKEKVILKLEHDKYENMAR